MVSAGPQKPITATYSLVCYMPRASLLMAIPNVSHTLRQSQTFFPFDFSPSGDCITRALLG